MVEKIDISQMFKLLRKKLGFTQGQMAEAMDIGLRFYSDLESGKKKPSFETVLKAKYGLKMTVAEMIGETEIIKKAKPIPTDQLEEIKNVIRTELRPLSDLLPIVQDMPEVEMRMVIDFAKTVSERRSPEAIKAELDSLKRKKHSS